jgi:hypothetical protein
MHIEILIEDSSGQALLKILVPRIIGAYGEPHTWRIIGYRGIGRLRSNLNQNTDPSKRALLDQLPRLVNGYGKTPGIDAVVFVVDSDSRDCRGFLAEIKTAIESCQSKPPKTMVRLAIEEIEAWYLGDLSAIQKVYPRAKRAVLGNYVPDSICGTWERLADAVYPKGVTALKKSNRNPGDLKHEWAKRLGPEINIENNLSPSFQKFCSGLKTMTSPC